MILEIALVLTLGGLTGVGELTSRYRDEPVQAVCLISGMTYVAINALAALGAFAVIRAFGWRFGLAADASAAGLAAVQVLVAGLGAAALFRSSLFSVRAGKEDVDIGPSALLQVLLRSVDRAVDRRRGITRLRIVGELASNLSFDRDAIELAAYGAAALQNVSDTEADWLGSRGNALRLRDDVSDDAKMRLFALDLMVLTGEDGLRAAIEQLKQVRSGTSREKATGESLGSPSFHKEVSDPMISPMVDELDPPSTRALDEPSGFVEEPPAHSEAELDEEIGRLNEVINLCPDLAESHLALGRAVARRALLERRKDFGSRHDAGSHHDAEKSLKKALALWPTYPDAHLETGRLLTVFNDSYPNHAELAETAIHAALRFSDAPEMTAAAMHQLAVLKRMDAIVTDCLPWLEASFKTGAAPPDWRLACAAIHLMLDDQRSALAQLVQAVELFPEHASCWILLGLTHQAMQALEPAADALARAPELVEWSRLESARSSEIRDYCLRAAGEGRSYQQLGDATRAVEMLSPVLSGFLPGCTSFFPGSSGGVDRPGLDIAVTASRIVRDVLVTHLGEPVRRFPSEGRDGHMREETATSLDSSG